MAATNTDNLAGNRNGRRNGMLYPLMLIAAVAVILFSVVGIATMTGLMPGATSKSGSQATLATPPAPARTMPARGAAAQPAQQPGPRAAAGTACADCGVIESIRAVEGAAPASGLGAVAGGVIGGVVGNQIGGGRGRTAMTVVGAGAGAYAGHEVEKNMNRSVSYRIGVRMSDGSHRTFHERSQPALSVGQKVRVTDGRVVAAG